MQMFHSLVNSYSQETRGWWESLWDHHFGWDALLSSGGYSGWAQGLDQSHSKCCKVREITGLDPSCSTNSFNKDMQSWDLFERKCCQHTSYISSSVSSKNKTFVVSLLPPFDKKKKKLLCKKTRKPHNSSREDVGKCVFHQRYWMLFICPSRNVNAVERVLKESSMSSIFLSLFKALPVSHLDFVQI